MNIKGKLIEIYDAKQITDKFKKREFVVEYAENTQYPQFIKFELTQNNCDFLDGFSKGEYIDVQFDLRGKPWTNKEGVTTYFTSLAAWKIQATSPVSTPSEEDNTSVDSNEEDLPF